MKYYNSFEEYNEVSKIEEAINNYYDNLSEEDLLNEVTKDELAKGGASGAGWAVGAGTGAVAAAALKSKGVTAKTASNALFRKGNIPYAIAGAILTGGLVAILRARKKRKSIEYILKDETDDAKRERLKEELSKLKMIELTQLKNYKKKEELAKVKAKLLADKGHVTKSMDKKGEVTKEKIAKLKEKL